MEKIIFIGLILSGLIFSGCSTTTHDNSSVGEKKEYPVSSEAEAKYQLAEKQIIDGQYKSASELLRQAYKLTQNDSQREKILFLLAEDMFLLGSYGKAHKFYQSLLNTYPKTTKLNEVIKRELEIGFKYKDFDLIRNTLRNYPYAEPSEEYRFKLADCLFNLNNYDEALKEYDSFIKIYPKSKLLTEAEYHMALCYLEIYEENDHEITPLSEAQKITSKFAKKYPGSSLNNNVDKLQEEINSLLAKRDYEVALFYIKKGKLKSARVYLESVIKNYPNTKWAKESNDLLTISIK